MDTLEHKQFEDLIHKFIDKEIEPYYDQWEKDKMVDRDLWRKMGAAGLLCPQAPEEYGGMELDMSFNLMVGGILSERLFCSIATGIAIHSDIVANYLIKYGNEAVKQKFLPGMVTGDIVAALGMTEPSAGSDVQGIKTRAVENGYRTKGEERQYIVNGSKIFITNGYHCDLILTAVVTDPTAGPAGVSLLAIDTSLDGVSKGQPLNKLGQHAQDTCEVFFDSVYVDPDMIVGHFGHGFFHMMEELPLERLAIGVAGVRVARSVLTLTIEYVKGREAFGKPISKFQNTKFKIAEMDISISAAEAYLDKCIDALLKRELSTEEASKIKVLASDLQCQVADACLQLHGGYGYMMEYPVARAYLDSRVQPIYGGTNEIMKEVISRKLLK